MRAILTAVFLLLSLPAWSLGCLPKELGGSGAYLNLTQTDTGYSLQWTCIDSTGAAIVSDVTWLKSFTPACKFSPTALPSSLDAANALLASCQASMKVATPGDPAYPDPALDAVYKAGLVKTRAMWAADHPASGPVYKVPANGSSVYPVTAGKLGAPISGKRATGGAVCDCSKPITQFGYTYCAYQGGAANEVALCVKP